MKPKPERKGKARRDAAPRRPSSPPPNTRAIGGVIDSTARSLDVEVLEAFVSRSRLVRVVIDRESGLDTDLLVSFIKRLRRGMEDAGCDPGDFQIEVDTPGETRLLKSAAHFKRFAGEHVRVSRDGQDGVESTRYKLIGARGASALVEDPQGQQSAVDPASVREIRLEPPAARKRGTGKKRR